MPNGPSTGLGGGLQGLLRFLAEQRAQQERERVRAEEAEQLTADRSLRERQIAATEQQAEFERQGTLAGLVQPTQAIDPSVYDQLGPFAGIVAEPQAMEEGAQGPRQMVGRTPFQPSEFMNLGGNLVRVDPSTGTANTLLEAPETFETLVGVGAGGDREFVQLGQRGTKRPTGLQAPVPPGENIAWINAQARAADRQSRNEIARETNAVREIISRMNNASAADRTALATYAQLASSRLRAVLDQARLQMDVQRNLPEGWFGGGPDDALLQTIQDASQALQQIDQLAPTQGMGDVLDRMNVPPGVLAPEQSSTPAPAASPVREDPLERARRLRDELAR